MSLTAKKWILTKQFAGVPKLENFKLEEEAVSLALKPGEIAIEALYVSVDPYMRIFPLNVGDTLFGDQIGRVKVSNNADFPEGTLVLSFLGWRTLTVLSNPEAPAVFGPLVRKLPDFGDLPPSLALGCVGMPGLTAYFGLLERGEAKAGDVVLVSAAAGAVGSVVGQIAKIKGCTVIGSAGSKEKCDWLKELGFDHVFNYKETAVDEALKQFAPGGIDLYFDNVAGDFSFAVLQNHMKVRGRVVCCGAISEYNTDNTGRSIYLSVIGKMLELRGMSMVEYKNRYSEGMSPLLQWVKEGKLKHRETITEGIERAPEAFISLFRGANTGKIVVKI
ncbi:prostaglandin reductase 1-like [Babylonia areolata]|uniref:prostaglandin reductase 1-like n=1 Tax=Babylonia areolata TaxID=304850 RepID=UPI003FD4910F